jgi:hypothetical protein
MDDLNNHNICGDFWEREAVLQAYHVLTLEPSSSRSASVLLPRKSILYLDSDRALISNVPRGSELIFLEQPYEALLGAREAREARSSMPAFRVGQLAKL